MSVKSVETSGAFICSVCPPCLIQSRPAGPTTSVVSISLGIHVAPRPVLIIIAVFVSEKHNEAITLSNERPHLTSQCPSKDINGFVPNLSSLRRCLVSSTETQLLWAQLMLLLHLGGKSRLKYQVPHIYLFY